MAVGNMKAVKQVYEWFTNKEYSKAIILAEDTLLTLKNRKARIDLYHLLGIMFHELNDKLQAAEYLRKALAMRKKKVLYKKLFEIYNELEDVRNLELLLQEALIYYPADYEFLSFVATAFSGLDRYDKALYYLIDAKKWGLIASLSRHFAFWEKLPELDELFFAEVQMDKIQAYNRVVAFTAMQMPVFSQKDFKFLIKKCAKVTYASELGSEPLVEGFERKVPMQKKGPLKIGYLSADFFDHATMLLLARVLEVHNNTEFEIHLFILNESSNTVYEKRIADMKLQRHYVSGLSHKEVAQLIKEQNIHILVDLKGFTNSSGTGIVALRPAPIIVNWLGFPNTVGLERLADYIITDQIVTPIEHAPFFSETLAYMPHCYQPNDNTILNDKIITREQAGLPEDKIVFCSFNQIVKLHPRQFDYWCRVLRDVPDSVLWLLRPRYKLTQDNILREAEARGVSADRIIFAESMPMAEHRLRLKLADIAFDSFPCTSHTTASDLMATCVPLIAQIGNTFPSRVSASVVTANNCPQFVAHNIEEAYALAYALATNKELLANVKAEMKNNLKTAPLYNSELFTKNLERLYKAMWEQYQNGKKEIIILD